MIKPGIFLFTDGSCSGRGSDMGAWAGVVCTLNRKHLLYGTMYPATINRCELLPIVLGVKWIRDNLNLRIPIRVYTDSEHTAQGINGLFAPEDNLDLWAAYRAAALGLQIECRWRERNSHPYMVLCDGVASGLRMGQIEIAERMFSNWKNVENELPEAQLPEDEIYNVMEGVKNANSASG